MFPFSTKREISHFHVVVSSTTAKKCTKKRDARAKLLFCQSKPIGFIPFSLPSPSSLLKLPSNVYPPATLKFKPCSVVFCLFRKDRGRTTDKAVRV